MPLLIGTDEAGYGPNLGPLLVTATSWTLPDGLAPDGLWEALGSCVAQVRSRKDDRLHVADSKQVYSSGKSILQLELGVHAFARQLDISCDTLENFGVSISGKRFRKDYADVTRDTVSELSLPVVAEDSTCADFAERVREALKAADVQLNGIRSRIIFPEEFNRGVEKYDSKGKVLSEATLSLVRESFDAASCSDGWVFCDKHGGRNRYDDVISNAFDDEFVFRLEESRASSRYRVGELEFCFRTKAEELLPVALASMVAKYVRELVMMQFNAFWQHHVSDLKPTKGYPVDAKRFWEDIEDTVNELKIPREKIWRCR